MRLEGDAACDRDVQLEAQLAVVATGWVANTEALDLANAGVRTDQRGCVQVDRQLRTTAQHIFAAGDITGQVMVVHEAAREGYLAATVTERFDSLPRPLIDGRPNGFCKLIVDHHAHTILGCHIVGERAGELAQLAAIAMASQMKVEQLALVPFRSPLTPTPSGVPRSGQPPVLREEVSERLVRIEATLGPGPSSSSDGLG